METLPSIKQLSFPLWVTPGNRLASGVLLFLITAIFYFPVNHYPIYPAKLLPMTWIDHYIPFMPQTVYVYLSEVLLFAAGFLGLKNMENINKFLYSFYLIVFISFLIFTFTPTVYPRELFPLPHSLDEITFQVFSQLRIIDSPYNCNPSLHVSGVYICAMAYRDEDRRKFYAMMIWATAVALSTLTTKQHYLVDVITGALLANFSYWLFYYKARYHDIRKSADQANL